MNSTFQPLEATIVSLARGLYAAQPWFDASYQKDADYLAGLALKHGLEDHPLLPALLPLRMQLVSAEVEAQVAVETRRESGVQVAARLNGTVVYSFFEARYGSTESQRSRLRLEVVSVHSQTHKQNK